MKRLVYILFAVLAFQFSGCEREYEDESRITYFPDMTILGDPLVYVAANSNYVDEGAEATENDQPIQVTTTTNLDLTTPGSYSTTYTATNSDGYAKSVERQILVYDPDVNATDLSGSYTGAVVRNGTEGYSNIPITLTPVAAVQGMYVISDWISGFYADGRAYGAAYRFTGHIQINASNEVIEISMSNPWGDPFDDVVGTYDPATQTISYTANWIGTYAFVVDLVKN